MQRVDTLRILEIISEELLKQFDDYLKVTAEIDYMNEHCISLEINLFENEDYEYSIEQMEYYRSIINDYLNNSEFKKFDFIIDEFSNGLFYLCLQNIL